MVVHVSCIVEGEGDETAIPDLFRRIAEQVVPGIRVKIVATTRRSRSEIVKPGILEKDIELAARKLEGNPGGIFVLIDADNDCPATLGPRLLDRARKARNDTPIAVVLAMKEYEAWFLASAETFGIEPPPDPEAIRGAKEWLKRKLVGSGGYDQREFTRKFDLDLAKSRSASFDKCFREVSKLLSVVLPPE